MKKVLFLCSGNYYRSRFAEMLFNHRAGATGLDWRADSRAVSLPESRRYIRGPISPFCLDALAARGIRPDGEPRYPIQVEAQDLAGSDLVIAMKEAEHRGPIERDFSAWAARVHYWKIDDIDCSEPDDAMGLLDLCIDQLIGRLARGEPGDGETARAG